VIISTLTGNPALWAKAVLFATYDENGGSLTTSRPSHAPGNTRRIHYYCACGPDPTVVGNPPFLGPSDWVFVYRMLVISPFSRGGLVSSALFDHPQCCASSRHAFGAEVPN